MASDLMPLNRKNEKILKFLLNSAKKHIEKRSHQKEEPSSSFYLCKKQRLYIPDVWAVW